MAEIDITVPGAKSTEGAQVPASAPVSGTTGTDPVSIPSQVTPAPVPPAVEPKFTDADMAAARRKWDAEAREAAAKAAKDATEAEAIEQGKAKEVARERLETIRAHEATIAGRDAFIGALSTHVNAQIEVAIKNLSPVLKEFDPGIENLAARMEWFAKIQKHPEALGQGTSGVRVPGTGFVPSPNGNRQEIITPMVSRSKF